MILQHRYLVISNKCGKPARDRILALNFTAETTDRVNAYYSVPYKCDSYIFTEWDAPRIYGANNSLYPIN